MIALFLAAAVGTASGSMVVGGKATALHHAYAVEKNTLLKVIVSAIDRCSHARLVHTAETD